MDMTFARVRPTIVPSKGTEGSAGLDLYVPTFNEQFKKDFDLKSNFISHWLVNNPTRLDLFDKEIAIESKDRVIIPLGLKFNIPVGYGLFAFNKSGVVFKQTIIKLAEVIDSDYQGEIFLSIYNYGPTSIRIQEHQKIIQLVLLEVPNYILKEVGEFLLYPEMSIRGLGAMGSTGLHE